MGNKFLQIMCKQNCIIITNKILIILISFSFYSCATLLNNEQTRIEVHTIPDSTIVCLSNGTFIKTPFILEVPRSYNDFSIIVKNDSCKKSIKLKSRVAPEFKWGNLLLVYFCPIGYLIDATIHKNIYTYDNSILIDMSNKHDYYKKWKSSKRGQFYIRSSLPWVDFIEFDNGRGYENYKSYIGITIGVDYYHSKGSYLSFSGGSTGITDNALPLIHKRYIDTSEYTKTYSLKFTNNHDINIFSSEIIDFTLGYGLSYSHFEYEQFFFDTIKSIKLYKSSISTFGLCFDLNVIFFKHYFIGINIMPSLYTSTRKKWEYSYLSYFDFGLKFPIRNYKNKNLKVVQYKPKLIE